MIAWTATGSLFMDDQPEHLYLSRSIELGLAFVLSLAIGILTTNLATGRASFTLLREALLTTNAGVARATEFADGSRWMPDGGKVLGIAATRDDRPTVSAPPVEPHRADARQSSQVQFACPTTALTAQPSDLGFNGFLELNLGISLSMKTLADDVADVTQAITNGVPIQEVAQVGKAESPSIQFSHETMTSSEIPLTIDSVTRASVLPPPAPALTFMNMEVDFDLFPNDGLSLLVVDITKYQHLGPTRSDRSRTADVAAIPLPEPIASSVSSQRAQGIVRHQSAPTPATRHDPSLGLDNSKNATHDQVPAVMGDEHRRATDTASTDDGRKDVPSPSSDALADAESSQEATNTTTESASELDNPDSPVETAPAEPPLGITRQMSLLQPRIAKTLRFYFNRPLNTRDDSAWSVMHSILGYGANGQVEVNGRNGPRTNAVVWMCENKPCAHRTLLYLENGYLQCREGPGYQGHPAQFLAMLAQVGVPHDHPIHVQGRSYTVADLVKSEQRGCSTGREATFKLIALSHYLPTDASWTSASGETWNLPRLLEIELSQPVNGAACGGTHRIMAISLAVRTRQLQGKPLAGPYLRAQRYVRQYHHYVMSLQNRDGSFSSDWFKKQASWGDKERQLQTTGHILEWLVYSLPRNELADPRVVRSVEFLTNLMTRHRYHTWEVGPRGHAIRALRLYHQRVFEQQASPTTHVAQRTETNR